MVLYDVMQEPASLVVTDLRKFGTHKNSAPKLGGTVADLAAHGFMTRSVTTSSMAWGWLRPSRE